MIRSLLISLAFCCAAAQANCVPDMPEIGDAGPDGSTVCGMLQQRFPQARLEIRDREIRSADSVSVLVSIDGRPQPFVYRLIRADWVLMKPRVADMH